MKSETSQNCFLVYITQEGFPTVCYDLPPGMLDFWICSLVCDTGSIFTLVFLDVIYLSHSLLDSKTLSLHDLFFTKNKRYFFLSRGIQ